MAVVQRNEKEIVCMSKHSIRYSIVHNEAGCNELWRDWVMENTTTKAVELAKLRVAGLKRAIDDEPSADVKATMLTCLRREEDHLSDYAMTGIYEEE
jgi:hypothetical protein